MLGCGKLCSWIIFRHPDSKNEFFFFLFIIMQPVGDFFMNLYSLNLFLQWYLAINVAGEGGRTYRREPETEAGDRLFQNLAHLFVVHEFLRYIYFKTNLAIINITVFNRIFMNRSWFENKGSVMSQLLAVHLIFLQTMVVLIHLSSWG